MTNLLKIVTGASGVTAKKILYKRKPGVRRLLMKYNKKRIRFAG